MKLLDKLEIIDQETTPEGFLRVKARISRTGIQEYLLSELSPKDTPGHLSTLPGDSIVRLNRTATDVFHSESLATISGAPVTDGHPPCFVHDENRALYSRGSAVGTPTVDGDFVVAELLIKDSALIDKIKSGVKQISLGYDLSVDWTQGLDDRYGVFDGFQRDIRVNHVAVLQQGRGGSRVRIFDKQFNTKDTKMLTRLIDGISVEFSDQGAEVVDKLQAAIADLKVDVKEAKQKLVDASAKTETLEGEIAVKDARIKELDDQDLDALVTARLTVVDESRQLSSELDPAGKSLHEIKTEAIKACDENLNLEGKSEDFVEGVFRALLAAAKSKSGSALDQAMVDAAGNAGAKDARTVGMEALRKQSEVKIWDRKVN